MDKTIKINLGGTLFQIDEEAYKILRRYLQDINDRLKDTPGGAETIEDIELRIAEIFQSMGGAAAVLSKDNVESMISTIGKPEDFDAGNETRGNDLTSPGKSVKKKLYRNPDDTIISGVCGGIGTYLNIEGVWIRLFFIILTCFFLMGLFIYAALWIALPSAGTEAQKREMYGREDFRTYFRKRNESYSFKSDSPGYSPAGSGVGNAFNEIFRAVGKVFFIIFRIILIMIGIIFVICGFLALVSFVMVFFFKYPGYFSTNTFGVNLFYFPDFLDYIVNPALAPWIIVLLFIVILMPLLALIYWGVKMIFWFRAKDGVFSLIGLIIWVVCLAALSILLFNEGISFTESAKSVSEVTISKAPSDLYIIAGKKVEDLRYDKAIEFDEDEYRVFFNDDNRGLFISSGLDIYNSDETSARIVVSKRSSGRSRTDAQTKAGSLIYNYKISNDTLFLDEYFTIPENSKWSVDEVRVDLYLPEGTRVHFDRTTEEMYHHRYSDITEWYQDEDSFDSASATPSTGSYTWVMTEEGLRKRPTDSRRE